MVKPMHVASDIVAIADLKARISEVVRDLGRHGRPIVVTQNGKPAAVMLSPDEFDRLAESARFIEAVREGLADSEAGRVISDAELTDELDRRYGRPKR